jgi:hypothetical protein
VRIAAPSAGASIVVTVPDLGAVASASVPAAGVPGVAAGSGAVGSGVSGTKPAVLPPRTTPGPTSSGAATAAAPTRGTSTSVPVPPTQPADQTRTAATASSSSITPPTTAVSTMNVTLANCPRCTVLATHAAVTSTLGAALVATAQGRAALLSLRGDGSVAGAANVAYGTSFPTPPGGQLGCDASGRCIVIAQQTNGTAIAAAYRVSAQGTWVDVTGQPGISSVTSEARTLTVAGGVGVAVQDKADGSTVWIVYGWDGNGYSVKGCTAAATPDPNALTMMSCLS